nr:MAG TPA: hypothetical protein [Caudoviricetes sp.]
MTSSFNIIQVMHLVFALFAPKSQKNKISFCTFYTLLIIL